MTEKGYEEPASNTGKNEGAMSTNENVRTKESLTTNVNASLKDEILDFLCQNDEIVFKSQQIDDPELTVNEKKQIANEILEENHRKFLSRFGRYLKNEHLSYFEIKNVEENEMNLDENEEEYEVNFLIKDLRKNLEHKHKNIKNRRYAAMQALIKEKSYFSEKEMMRREPHLYDQLIGQYLTESERRVRDSYDPKNTTFTNILFDKIDKERMDDLRKEQENAEEMSNDDSVSRSSSIHNDGDGDSLTPPVERRQWGNFESDNNQDQSVTISNKITSCKNNARNQKQQKFITVGEREMLRQEFLGIMYSKFLEGKEDFDYSKVDNNADLDDLNQINQDNEDKYFDESDNDDNLNTSHNVIDRMDEDIESEDDLDLYMKHLSKHPTLRRRNDEEEEDD